MDTTLLLHSRDGWSARRAGGLSRSGAPRGLRNLKQALRLVGRGVYRLFVPAW